MDVEYSKDLHDSHNDVLFLQERMKVNKCNKLVCNLYHKNNYVVHIRIFNQKFNSGLVFKKVHKVIQCNQEAWLK